MAKQAAATLAETDDMLIAPDRSIGYQVRRLSQEMSVTMDSYVSRHGISSAQWGYLRHIYFEEGVSQRELSDRVGRQGASTVVALKRLEQIGYVTTRKNDNDARKNHVYLTEKGRELVLELLPYVNEVQEIAFRGFSPKEVDAFWRAVARMRSNFSSSSSGQWPIGDD